MLNSPEKTKLVMKFIKAPLFEGFLILTPYQNC
jgi:hypothetical protein